MNAETSTVTDAYWLSNARPYRASVLRKPLSVDACIVGAGISGLSVAYHLAKDGLSVAVLDAGRIGCGETSLTTAHLVTALDRRYEEIVGFHGERLAQLIADSHRSAIATIGRIAREERIDCDFEFCDGYLLGTGEKAAQTIENEHNASIQAGLDTTIATDHPYRRIGEPCLRFPRQAKFHPMKYLHGLAAFVKKHGGHVHHNSKVKDIVGGKDAHVVTESGVEVKARHIVVTTNTPVNNRFTMHTRIAAYRTYVVGFQIPANEVFADLVWDTDEPFHYVRCHQTAGGSPILIVGGEDHKTGQGDSVEIERFERLETWARELFPMAGERTFAWSGQVMESLDGIAYIGRNPGDEDNVYIATGDCGNGMTHGTIAGVLLSTLIQGRENPWVEVFDPGRTRIHGAWKFVKENANVAAQYAAWITPGDVANVDQIPADSGAVLRRGASKVAVYRDTEGQIHEMTAVCPHLGCVVDWNSAEKSWDCPCHGSRFSSKGEVLNGPALTGLETVEESPKKEADETSAS